MAESPRSQIYAWMREETQAKPIVRIPDLTATVVERLMGDEDLLRAWLAENVSPLAYDFAQRFCARTRGHVVFGDTMLSREQVDETARTRRPRWQAWLEHTGDKHVRLFDMMRQDLWDAANIREQRGQVEYHYAALWRELAGRLNEVQSVKEVFSEKEIEAIAASLKIRVRVRREQPAQVEEKAA